MALTSSWCAMDDWFLCSYMNLSQVTVLTCIEHWVPLFAAGPMEVNRQMSFRISPLDQQPMVCKSYTWWDWRVSTNKCFCLTVSSQTRKAFVCFFFFYLSLRLPLELLPVDPARVRLPLDSPESFRVRLPTCSLELALLTVLAEKQETQQHGTCLNTVTQGNGVIEVNSTARQCVLFTGLRNHGVRCATCAFQLHHRQPDSPTRDNKNAPSAVYWPAGLVT